jgi:hypothetical protein
MLSDRIFPIDVELSDTIQILYTKIEKKEQIPSDQQWLIFDGKHLDDEKTLNEYNIQNDSTIHLIQYLR